MVHGQRPRSTVAVQLRYGEDMVGGSAARGVLVLVVLVILILVLHSKRRAITSSGGCAGEECVPTAGAWADGVDVRSGSARGHCSAAAPPGEHRGDDGSGGGLHLRLDELPRRPGGGHHAARIGGPFGTMLGPPLSAKTGRWVCKFRVEVRGQLCLLRRSARELEPTQQPRNGLFSSFHVLSARHWLGRRERSRGGSLIIVVGKDGASSSSHPISKKTYLQCAASWPSLSTRRPRHPCLGTWMAVSSALSSPERTHAGVRARNVVATHGVGKEMFAPCAS